MSEEEVVDKLVIDNSGNLIGKCIDIRDNEEDENLLIVEVKTKQKGKITVDVPMSTIQAIGKTIILSVEIEGLVKDQEIIAYKEEINEEIIEAEPQEDTEMLTQEQALPEINKNETEKLTSDKWIIYKSIKSKKTN